MDRHIVVCGFSRGGTTLFYNMLRNCVENFEFMDRETRGLESINLQGSRITKRPLDFLEIENIKNRSTKKVDFIFCIRDPRSLITSYHKSVPEDYFQGYKNMYFIPSGGKPSLTYPGIKPTYDVYNRVKDEVFTLRYEDLIRDPDATQRELGECLGLEFKDQFKNFGTKEENIPENLQRALNGIRPIDESRTTAWMNHPERIKEEFNQNPDFFDVLIDLGYEKDNSWFKNI